MLRRFVPWSKGKGAALAAADPWSLSTPLLQLSKHDSLTIGQAMEGILILGATGSGKSTGSGKQILLSFLRSGFGGLVLCVKPDEAHMIESYCRATGRLEDLVIFGPEHPFRFNFIEHERRRRGRGGGLTQNLCALLSTICEITQRDAGKGGGQEDGRYWEEAKQQLLRNLMDLLIFANQPVSIPNLYQAMISAPRSIEHARSESWRKASFCYRCLEEGQRRSKSSQEAGDFELVADYWLVSFAELAEKTRSIITSSFTAMIDLMNRGVLRELFCGETNITPEAIEHGRIIVVDLPLKEFRDVGRYAAALWKYCFQVSIERRDVQKSPRPVFLWQDEAQNFILSSDMLFQATARSSRVSNVVLTQNIPNFYASLGGNDGGKAQVDSLFGNLCLKVFHSNADSVTNQWAAEILGKSRQYLVNCNTRLSVGIDTRSIFGGGVTGGTAGISEQELFAVPPSRFTELRTGGPAHQFLVDAIVFANGAKFHASGKTWMRVTFNQKQ